MTYGFENESRSASLFQSKRLECTLWWWLWWWLPVGPFIWSRVDHLRRASSISRQCVMTRNCRSCWNPKLCEDIRVPFPPPPPPSRSTFLLPIPLRLIPIPGAGSPFLFKCDLIYSSQSLSEIPIACHQSRVNRFVKSLWSWSPAEILVSLPRYSGAAEAALVSLGRSFDTRMWLACHLEMDGGGYDACFLFSGQFWTENWCGAFPSVAQVDYSKLKAWRWPL